MSHLLNRFSGRKRGLTLAAVLVAAASIAGWLLLTAQSAPPDPSAPSTDVVSSIDIEGVDLKRFPGIEFSVLAADIRPEVSRQAAENKALDTIGNTSLLDAVFARVATPRYDGPAWIVGLDRPETESLIVIVDAQTGEFIMAAARGWDHGGPAAAPQPLSAPNRIGQ